MFAQVIEGRTDDVEGVRRQEERWRDELMSGVAGFLGSTTGVTSDGTYIAIVRFENEAAARRNADDPMHSGWWEETEKYLFDIKVHESSDVELSFGGGSDAAGFVQVMQGQIHDLARLRELEQAATKDVEQRRPDVIGSARILFDDGGFTESIYFTSEAEAREGEQKGMPEDSGPMDEWEAVVRVDRYLDLTDPWLLSP